MLATRPAKRNKFGARPAWRCLSCGGAVLKQHADRCPHCAQVDTVRRFDSRAEARRFDTLRLMERAGQIHGLECQPRYALTINGERVADYVADFRYTAAGDVVVEDVKGGRATDTQTSKLKRKIVAALYGVDVQVVRL